jgi:outer membrane murein-binding lipoprotein Lpp
MKRFSMLVGVAVVAAAMYVAAGTASQQSKGPTAKQFKALKAQVASLSKKLKSTRSEADAAVGFIGQCLVSTNSGVLPINEFGDPAGAFGYEFDNDGAGVGAVAYTTALDVDTSTTTPFSGVYIQGVDPTCVQAALRHRAGHAGSSRLLLRGERLR